MPTHYKGSAGERRALDLFIKLMRASDRVRASSETFLRKHELSPGQFGVLETLFHLGPLVQKDLAHKLLSSEGNITQIIDKLEKKKLVKRERNINDKRSYEIHLTPGGKARIADVFPGYASHMQAMMKPLKAGEQEELSALCKKLGISIDI